MTESTCQQRAMITVASHRRLGSRHKLRRRGCSPSAGPHDDEVVVGSVAILPALPGRLARRGSHAGDARCRDDIGQRSPSLLDGSLCTGSSASPRAANSAAWRSLPSLDYFPRIKSPRASTPVPSRAKPQQRRFNGSPVSWSRARHQAFSAGSRLRWRAVCGEGFSRPLTRCENQGRVKFGSVCESSWLS